MNYSIEILPQALDNIESAYRWMADNISPERAEQWYLKTHYSYVTSS